MSILIHLNEGGGGSGNFGHRGRPGEARGGSAPSSLIRSNDYVLGREKAYRHTYDRVKGEHVVHALTGNSNEELGRELYRGSNEGEAHAVLKNRGVKNPNSLLVVGDRWAIKKL